jgi:hypothetical protein
MKILIISLIAFSLLSGCGQTSREKSGKAEQIAAGNEKHQDTGAPVIELNTGQKWKVNDEMIPHILKMEKDFHAYLASGQKDYKSLAEKLQKGNNDLISSCTMQGKAHDELHKWLHPQLELVQALSNASTDEEAEKVVTKLKRSFDTFHTYFQ